MLLRARRFIQRLGFATAGALLAALLAGAWLVAQQPVIGVFSRLYYGGTGASQPQGRWGAGDPEGASAAPPGSYYLRTNGAVYLKQSGTGNTGWVQVANTTRIGDDFYATAYGAVCDGQTDDTDAIQAAINDAYETASGAGRVILPAGTCATTGIQLGPVTNPWQVSEFGNPLTLNNADIVLTSGTNNFELTSGGLVADHVGKSMTFAVPLVKSTIAFDGTPFSPSTPSTFDGRWAKYFLVDIVSVIDPTHGTFSIRGLQSGSLRVNQFPDLPHANNCVNLPSGVPGDGCTSSYWCHEYAHLLSDCGPGSSPTIDALIDYAYMATYQGVSPGLAKVYPYSLPDDTDARFVSMRGASEAKTLLRWIGNNTKLPVIALSKNKYFTVENVGVFNATNQAPGASAALAGAGAGNVNNGLHSYRIACWYDLRLGTWGSQGSVTVVNNATDGQVTVSTPVCNDDDAGNAATARDVLRTKSGSTATTGPWYFVATIANNSQTTYIDNIADSSLGAQAFQYGNAIGWYLGGLPGVGTQTLVGTLRNVSSGNEGVGFRYGYLAGDNLGGETSEMRFERISMVGNDVGFSAAPGGFNVLDMFLDFPVGGFNKVAIENNDGNMMITNCAFSYNGIDFYSKGFGPLSIRGCRSEGPGRFFYGGEPGVRIEEVLVAEPQATRPITGNVIATPDNIRTETINVTSTTCPLNICPVTFGAGDVTGLDARKVVVLPGLGSGGNDIIAYINAVTTTTAGSVWVQNGTMTSTGAVSATIYETNTVDLTWPSGQIYANDVGSSIKLPDASVPNAWNGDPVDVFITQYLTATTGKGFFYLGSTGRGPVDPGGGTTANPTLFDRVTYEIIQGDYQYSISNVIGSGSVKVDPVGTGALTLHNVTHLMADATLLNSQAAPVRWVRPGLRYDISPYTAVPQNNPNLGIPFAVTSSDTTNNSQAGGTDFTVYARDVKSNFYAGPTFRLADGDFRIRSLIPMPLISMPRPNTSTPTGDIYYQNYPYDPVAPTLQLNGLKELSETIYVNGRNLRIGCTFATSNTATCAFERNESYTFNSNGTGGTTSDPATRTFRILTTSGNFTQLDVGKTIQFPDCCGDFAGIAGGGRTLFATITSIIDATHVECVSAQSLTGVFPNGTTMGTAVVGQDEPNANWMPVGLTCSANETFWVSSWNAAGVTLGSSNASSTASCRVLVVR